MTITGILKHKFDSVLLGGKKGMSKREFVVDYKKEGKKSRIEPIKFTIIDSPTLRCFKLDGFNIGEHITVHFTLKGREYPQNGEMKYFNDLRVFKIEK